MKVPQSTDGNQPQSGKPIRILNVDDSSDFRALVKEILEKEHHDFKVTEASTLTEFESHLAKKVSVPAIVEFALTFPP